MQEYGHQVSDRKSGLRDRLTRFGSTVTKVATEITSKAKEVITNLARRGLIAAHTAKEKLKPFCRTVKMRLGSTWQNILDYCAPADKEQDADCERYENAAAQSVLVVLEGPDPVETFCNLDAEAQKYVMSEIHRTYCQVIGIEPPEFAVVDDLPPAINGCYIYKHNLVLVNSALFKQPMEYAKAQELFTVLLHEDFHAFQYCAMLNPERYNVPREVAKMWRDNEKNYISFRQNPIAYRLQPMEAYAYRVSKNAMALLRNKEYVKMVEDAINQKGES